jgi:hypothetical protein
VQGTNSSQWFQDFNTTGIKWEEKANLMKFLV